MSYPPQGQPYGHPQQPGGYPQQPGGYPQQPGGYPPPYPPGPPRKSNTGLIVALAAVAVAVVVGVVLVFTLTGDDDGSGSASGGGGGGETTSGKATIPGPNAPGGTRGGGSSGGKSTSPGSGGGSTGDGPRQLAQLAADSIEEKDTSKIDTYSCTPTVARELKSAMSQVPSGATATVGDVRENGSQAQALITLKMGSQSEGFTLEMKKDSSKWCISGL